MRYGTPARSYGSREGTPVGAGPSGIVPSPAQQLQQLHDAMHLSRRPPPPIVNGVTPYLDVMTISSAQFPATIDGAWVAVAAVIIASPHPCDVCPTRVFVLRV